MIQARGDNIRSGWKTMFGVFTVAAREPYGTYSASFNSRLPTNIKQNRSSISHMTMSLKSTTIDLLLSSHKALLLISLFALLNSRRTTSSRKSLFKPLRCSRCPCQRCCVHLSVRSVSRQAQSRMLLPLRDCPNNRRGRLRKSNSGSLCFLPSMMC